jgi:hypothetical protein
MTATTTYRIRLDRLDDPEYPAGRRVDSDRYDDPDHYDDADTAAVTHLVAWTEIAGPGVYLATVTDADTGRILARAEQRVHDAGWFGSRPGEIEWPDQRPTPALMDETTRTGGTPADLWHEAGRSTVGIAAVLAALPGVIALAVTFAAAAGIHDLIGRVTP